MRVLLVDSSDRGGIAEYTRTLARGLRDAGADVAVAAPGAAASGVGPLPAHPWGPEFERRSRARIYATRAAEVPRTTAALRRAVRTFHPDVVHFQTETVPRIEPLVLRALRRRVPVVITAHDPVPHEGGVTDLVRQARRWRAVDAVVIHGEEPARLVEASARPAIVRVIRFDLAMTESPPPSRTDARARLELGDPPIALLLGLLRSYKGLRLLADAWPDVRSALPSARLFVVGQAYDGLPELGLLAGLDGVEVREGFLSDADVDAWAAAADVLVLPYHHGTHSGVLHRGVAAGTPVLVSPPLAEEAAHMDAGAVVPLAPARWTAALIGALGDAPLPPPRPRPATTIAETLALYDELVRARGRR